VRPIEKLATGTVKRSAGDGAVDVAAALSREPWASEQAAGDESALNLYHPSLAALGGDSENREALKVSS
jgi:hypothetical protein